MQQSNQEPYPYQTDEVDLRKLFNYIEVRKLFIFSLTGFVTLLAMIYVFTISPTYKATTSFTLPSDSSILKINNQGLSSESKESVFRDFLAFLSSQEIQTKVFDDGGYLTALNLENEPIDNVKEYTTSFLSSIIVEAPVTKISKNEKVGDLIEKPYSLSIEGGNAEVISSYLNDLVESANTNTINKLIKFMELKINTRLDKLSIERELLITQEKRRRLKEIEVLGASAIMANSLGILDNNFKLIANEKADNILNISVLENADFPNWFMYGEKALLQRMELLQTRSNDEPFIHKLVELDHEKLKLESMIIDPSGISSMQLTRSASAKPIEQSTREIVILAFISSFMISIFLAIVMGAIKPDEERST